MSVLNIFKRLRGERTPDQQSTPDSVSDQESATNWSPDRREYIMQLRQLRKERLNARKAGINEGIRQLGENIKAIVERFKQSAESVPRELVALVADTLQFMKDPEYRRATLTLMVHDSAEAAAKVAKKGWEGTKTAAKSGARAAGAGVMLAASPFVIGGIWAGEKATQAAEVLSREFQNRVAQPTQEKLRQLQDSIQRIREKAEERSKLNKAKNMLSQAREAQLRSEALRESIPEILEEAEKLFREAEFLTKQAEDLVKEVEAKIAARNGVGSLVKDLEKALANPEQAPNQVTAPNPTQQ